MCLAAYSELIQRPWGSNAATDSEQSMLKSACDDACISCYTNFGAGRKAADPKQTAIAQFHRKAAKK